jgi:hypothetical protein
MVDPGRGARCGIRDAAAFDEPDPMAARRTAELAEARSRADEALHACAENGGLARLAFARMATRLAGLHVGAFWDPGSAVDIISGASLVPVRYTSVRSFVKIRLRHERDG